MNLFDQLRDIMSDKRNRLSEDCDSEKEFVPYLTQRWLSFHSSQFAQLLNCTSNVLWRAIEEKSMWYKMFTGIIPKTRFKIIKYIKKNKEEKTGVKIDADTLTYLAESYELSKKEVKQYLLSGAVDMKLIKKQLESN